MYNTPAIYLGEFELRIHWLLMALCFLLTMGLAFFLNRKKGGKPAVVAVYGVLAAALYMIAPFVLFLIGLTDQTFHYRAKRSGHPD